MHYSLIIIYILFCCYTGNSQRADTLRKYLDNSLAFTNKNKGVYPAVAIQTGDHWYLFAVYPDTGTLLKAYFKDRELKIKDGPLILYHPNNKKAMECRYVNNVQQGVWKYYYKNGQLKDSGMIKNNQMVNTWYSWYQNGQLMAVMEYLPPDSVADNHFSFASPQQGKTGMLEKDTLINHPHGQWLGYHENGKKKDSGSYVHNLREGEWINWYANGNTESKGKYKEGKQEGEWNYFFENGQTSTREQYRNEKVVAMECFDEAGNATGIFCSILKPPVAILDRFTDFNTYMLDHIFWPKELDGKEVNGIVKAQYTISKEGKMVAFTILETPHELLSKETERFFRSLEKWSPGVSHNRSIDLTVTIEVPFYR